MTYFGFLLIFLVVPIAALLCIVAWMGEKAAPVNAKAAGLALAIQVILAVAYTTPWDNYLVAQRVWFYNPAQVSGILLGYVPLEEYLFFVLEAALVGILWQLLAPRLPPRGPLHPSAKLRLWSCAAGAVLWGVSLDVLISGWSAGTYLGLIVVWALPPILLQLAFGADILWQRWRLIAALVILPAAFLSFADALAIRSGIWAIDKSQSTRIFLGALPLEEGVFFLVTVTLLAFGMTLSLASESRARLTAFRERLAAHGAAPDTSDQST